MEITNYLSEILIEKNILNKEDVNIFKFGIKQGMILGFNILTILVIGYFMKEVDTVIVYMASLIPLRTFAGGYHAKSSINCYFISILTVVLALITVNYIYLCPKICIYVLAISTIIIMKLAPIEAKNKPLDTMEVIVYRRKAITTLWILVLIALLLLFLDLHIYFASIVVAIMCVSIMLILGRYVIK